MRRFLAITKRLQLPAEMFDGKHEITQANIWQWLQESKPGDTILIRRA